MKKLTYLLFATFLTASNTAFSEQKSVAIDVYKSPSCGCCGKWVSHMERAGFAVTVHNENNLFPIKEKHHVNPKLQSCHTAVLKQNGYVFEGHIPSHVVKRFLEENPKDALGLAVPGMPLGSPGMEVGDKIRPYDVYLMKKNGEHVVYERIDKLAN